MNTMNAASANKLYLILLVSIAPSCLWALKFEIPKELREEVAEQKAAEAAELEAEVEALQSGEADAAETTEATMEFVVEAPADEAEAVDTAPAAVESVEAAPAEEVTPEEVAAVGRIAGQVFDKETGQPLRGVAIVVADTVFGTITGSQGRYRLSGIPVGNYTLSFIKSGFLEANITDTAVVAGEVKKLDFAMPPRPLDMSDEVYELQDFTVSADEVVSQNVALLALRQQSVASLEALSSEDFAKFAASDAAEAISKISGASLSDGKYVVMRGLNDRYNTTLINGVRLPSPDPDRKAVAMDIFPTSLFDSIVARKTYTSDMPGESSGGSIELRTKSAPEELFVKFSYSMGKQITSGNTDIFLSDPEQIGYYDWLMGKADVRGYDLVPGSKEFLSDYPTEVGGVNFPRMAPNVGGFPNLGDRSFSFSMGNSWQINDGISMGAIFGLKSGEKQRTSYKEVFKKEINDSQLLVDEIALKENGGGILSSEQEYSMSLLGGLGFQIGDHSSLDYTYLRAQSLSSKATVSNYRKFGEVTLYDGGSTADNDYHNIRDIELLVEDRLLEAHQFSGEHVFEFVTPGEWTFSWYYTDAFMSQEEPDIRNVAEFYPDQQSFGADPGLEPLSRYQRATEQDSSMHGWSLGQDFNLGSNAVLSIEFGQDSERSLRDFEQLEMLNVDASYINDPYYGAMPIPDAVGLPNVPKEDRFQDTVGGMNDLIEDIYAINISNANNDFDAAETVYTNAQTLYNDANSDFLNKKSSFNSGFLPFIEPGANYDNFLSSNTYNQAIVDQELGRLQQGLGPTPGLAGINIINQDYAIAAYAESLLPSLQSSVNDAESSKNSAADRQNLINNEYVQYQSNVTPLLVAPAVNIAAVDYPSFSFFGDDTYVLDTPRGASLFSDTTVQSVQFDQVGGYFQARGRNEVKSHYFSGNIKVDDFLFFNSVRFASGLRNESTKLSYALLENAPGEPGPSSNMGGSVNPHVVRVDPIDQKDRLGYMALILEPMENFKIHLSKSTTVAKPTFREIAPFPIFNLADRSFEIGNPGLVERVKGSTAPGPERYVLPDDFAGLEIAEVESQDIRVEYFTPMDGMLSFGYFQKDVAAPIERVYAYTAGGVPVNTFINNDNDAELEGFEIELQQNLGVFQNILGSLGEMLTIGANYTKIEAQVTRSSFEQDALSAERVDLNEPNIFQEGGALSERPLYNQPEYVANAFISLDIEKTGTKLTLSNRWTGEKLDRVGGLDSSKVGVPDLFWDSFSALNLVIEQKLGDHFKIRFAVKNLNRPVRQLFEDDALFKQLADSGIYADSSVIYDATANGSYTKWRSRQTLDPTYSISISGSF